MDVGISLYQNLECITGSDRSAEAELYAMVETVMRAKGLRSLAYEVGFRDLSNVVQLGNDSSAAKSSVWRRGLGKMRHLEFRDLWQ